MAINPMTALTLGATGGALLSSAGDILPSQAERDLKKRREALQRQAEMGALGLTEQEQSALAGRLQARSNLAAQQAADERSRLLAGGGGATAGQALQSALASDEARMRQEGQINQFIAEKDLERKAMQRDELAALQAAQAEYAQRRKSAITGALGQGLEAFLMGKAQKAIQEPQVKAPEEIAVATETTAVEPMNRIPESQVQQMERQAVRNVVSPVNQNPLGLEGIPQSLMPEINLVSGKKKYDNSELDAYLKLLRGNK